MIRPFRFLLLALAVAACESPTESATPVPGEPSVQQQVWQQQGIDDYRYVLGRTCFCQALPLARVEVRDGQVVDVRDARTGEALSRQLWTQVLTVDGVFERMADAQAHGEAVNAEFHPTLGYPVRAMIGELAMDAGVGYSITGLQRLD
jgi:hypothetical protein